MNSSPRWWGCQARMRWIRLIPFSIKWDWFCQTISCYPGAGHFYSLNSSPWKPTQLSQFSSWCWTQKIRSLPVSPIVGDVGQRRWRWQMLIVYSSPLMMMNANRLFATSCSSYLSSYSFSTHRLPWMGQHHLSILSSIWINMIFWPMHERDIFEDKWCKNSFLTSSYFIWNHQQWPVHSLSSLQGLRLE